MAVELGVNANRHAVAHHQNRRVAERQAAGEQLLERGVEVFVGRLVFPGEGAGSEHVGIAGAATDDAVFFFKKVAGLTARLGHAQQFAQVKKVALRALLFVEVKGRAAGAPFLDEELGSHVHTQM